VCGADAVWYRQRKSVDAPANHVSHSIFIGGYQKSGTIDIDELNLDGLTVRGKEGLFTGNGKLTLYARSLKIESLPNPHAAGYTTKP
jgi:hypothetical protein